MNHGKIIFSQLMEYLPIQSFQRIVQKYRGNYKVKSFSCLDQFYSMVFAQLTYRSSLRDIETCLHSMKTKLYHMGIRSNVTHSTLAKANEHRDWRIYADFAQLLINQARQLYRYDKLEPDLNEIIYALDSTTIDLCLALFPWAKFRQRKAAVKLHTLLDLHGNLPVFIRITSGKIHDVNILDELIPEAGAFYLFDRAYLDFDRLHRFELHKSFFITRAKANLKYRRLYSHPVDKSSGLKSDQTIILDGYYQHRHYPEKLRRVRYYDSTHDHQLTFLTNNFSLPAIYIAQLYQCRWQIELFFKWIKQHLKIKSFYGTSPNAVKTQIWIAICVYVLIAIIKKRFKIKQSLYTFMQILSITIFEKVPILQLVNDNNFKTNDSYLSKQLNLFS